MTGTIGWQLLGWVALALNVWGNLALTSRGSAGWWIRLACNACWIPYAVYTGAWALLANHCLFAGINVYGWNKWRLSAGHDGWCRIARLRGVCNCGRLA